MIRYQISKKVQVGGYFGYGVGEGFATADRAAIPPPPDDLQLRARRGFFYGLQVSYCYWKGLDTAIAPTLAYWMGSQRERDQSIATLGVTFMFGRPNYTGDITEAFK
jgi:hypothetical protein